MALVGQAGYRQGCQGVNTGRRPGAMPRRALRAAEGVAAPIPPARTMSIPAVETGRPTRMGQFQQIPLQGIGPQTQVQPPLVGVPGWTEVRCRIAAATEPEQPRLVTQGRLEDVILVPRRQGGSPSQTDTEVQPVPFQFLLVDASPSMNS
jgi:hypothetical protein